MFLGLNRSFPNLPATNLPAKRRFRLPEADDPPGQRRGTVELTAYPIQQDRNRHPRSQADSLAPGLGPGSQSRSCPGLQRPNFTLIAAVVSFTSTSSDRPRPRGSFVPGIPPLALLLTALAVWSAGSGWLSAQVWVGDAPSGPAPFREPGEQAVWLDDTLEPDFQRLPPPDGSYLVDDPPTAPRSRDGGLGAGFSTGGSRAPFTARLSWIPAQALKNQPGELAVQSEELELAFPVRIDADGIWLALGSVQRLAAQHVGRAPGFRSPGPGSTVGHPGRHDAHPRLGRRLARRRHVAHRFSQRSSVLRIAGHDDHAARLPDRPQRRTRRVEFQPVLLADRPNRLSDSGRRLRLAAEPSVPGEYRDSLFPGVPADRDLDPDCQLHAPDQRAGARCVNRWGKPGASMAVTGP